MGIPSLPVDPSLSGHGDTAGLAGLLGCSTPDPLAWGKAASSVIAEGIPPIPVKVLEKIRRWEFIDLALLLSDTGAKSDEAPSLGSGGILLFQSVEQAQKRKRHIHDIHTWTQAFSVYAAALASADSTSKEEMVGLLAHLHLINQLAKDMGGSRWLKYDQDYREWAAAKGIRKWGELNLSLYGRCLSLQQPAAPQSQSDWHPERRGDNSKRGRTSRGTPKGACFKWNFEDDCEKLDCRYRHVCYGCGEGHRVGVCPRASKRPRGDR